MNNLFLEDALANPILFPLGWKVDRAFLENWIQLHNLKLPTELIDIWIIGGGGDFLETETLLIPDHTSNSDEVESIEKTTDFLIQNGFPKGFFIIHKGCVISAINQSQQSIFTFSADGYSLITSYSTINRWYKEEFRDQFGPKYGLK